MAALDDLDSLALVDLRAAIVPFAREDGPAGENVELRERLGGLRERGRLREHRGDKRLEDLALARQGVFLGAEDLLLLLAECLGHVALAPDRRLAADVVGGHQVQVRLGYLDVIAEMVREPHLEAPYPGAVLLGSLELRKPRLVVAGEGAQPVELGVVAGPDEVALLEVRGKLGRQGAVEEGPQGRQFVQLFAHACQARLPAVRARIRGGRAEGRFQGGQLPQRVVHQPHQSRRGSARQLLG